MNIQCSTDSDVWRDVTAKLEKHRFDGFPGSIFSDEPPPPAAIVTSERYQELWEAVSGKCDEIRRHPSGHGSMPGMRTAGGLGQDGRHMSAMCTVGHDDGTDSVWYVEGHVVTYQKAIAISVRGPFIDNHDQFWTEQASDRKGAVVIDHNHYRISPDLHPSQREMAGHGGRLLRIRMLATGEVIETRNLWHQGTVPPSWRDRLPDDAEFIKAEAPVRVTL